VGSSSGEYGHDLEPVDFRGGKRAFGAISRSQDQEATKDS